MAKTISVGTVGYPIKKNKMMGDVDVVEMTESRHIPPGKKAAKHLREDLPAAMQCCVQVSKYFVTPPKEGVTLRGDLTGYGNFQVTDVALGLWRRQLQFAQALDASALVIVTPPAVTPSSANVTAMAKFFDSVVRGGLSLVWEAHGPWEPEQIVQFSQAHQLVPAVDPLRDAVPDFDLAYFRFGAFAATGSRMGMYELEQIAAAALDCSAERVFCVFDTHRALDDARNLKKVIAEFGSEDFDDFDYDFTDDDSLDDSLMDE